MDHTAELVGDERDRQAHVVAMALHKIGPVLLRGRTIVDGRQGNKRAQYPDGENTQKSRPMGEVRFERIHDGHKAATREGHKCEHARQNAHHLHVRVYLAEQAT